jgi:serine/threonine protein kinase
VDEPGKEPGLVRQEARTCPVCGTKFRGAADSEFCPVCILRGAAEAESAATPDPGIEYVADGAQEVDGCAQIQQFENYELMLDRDGRPIELGRGAMGVTYKAFDVDLHCPVTLKVIAEKYLGNESARLRFLREARAAARVRHSNVASVFHLGRTGENYFYAMEFVEGETLQNLVRRSGRLEVKLALEIVAQVAAGLAAIHKQKLVHRDIKPSNIMVSVEEGDCVTAKIIDLGLAKPVTDGPAEAVISTSGAFAGTPEFASPEQFAGVGVDTRSDLYSLGAVLWEMLAGQAPFRGTSGEVMYKHQRAPLPLDLLEAAPQPIVALLQVLLEKDPARRFQNPAELLSAIPLVKDAIESGHHLMKTLRVFVSSTGDVKKERYLADRVMLNCSGVQPAGERLLFDRPTPGGKKWCVGKWCAENRTGQSKSFGSMSLFFGLSKTRNGSRLPGKDPQYRGIRSSDFYPLVASWQPVGSDLNDARWERSCLRNGLRNCLGVGPGRQKQRCAAVASLPQLLEADAAVGTERGSRSVWSAMGLRPGVLCALGDERRGGFYREVQQLF